MGRQPHKQRKGFYQNLKSRPYSFDAVAVPVATAYDGYNPNLVEKGWYEGLRAESTLFKSNMKVCDRETDNSGCMLRCNSITDLILNTFFGFRCCFDT